MYCWQKKAICTLTFPLMCTMCSAFISPSVSLKSVSNQSPCGDEATPVHSIYTYHFFLFFLHSKLLTCWCGVNRCSLSDWSDLLPRALHCTDNAFLVKTGVHLLLAWCYSATLCHSWMWEEQINLTTSSCDVWHIFRDITDLSPAPNSSDHECIRIQFIFGFLVHVA